MNNFECWQFQVPTYGKESKYNSKCRRGGNTIAKILNTCGYPYIHGILFSCQITMPYARSHVFKMSTIGAGFGVELVNRL